MSRERTLGVVLGALLLVTCRSALEDAPERPPWLSELSDLSADGDPGDAAPGDTSVESTPPVAEGFSLESPLQVLRRRLLLEQGLPLQRGAPAVLAPAAPPGPLTLDLVSVLTLGASHSDEYQRRKQAVFEAALALDLSHESFQRAWRELVSSEGFQEGQLQAAAGDVTSQLALDLVALMGEPGGSGPRPLADRSMIAPLLARAHEFVATVPLDQGQRDVIYALFELEHFRRQLAVRLASEYYRTLRTLQDAETHEKSYRWVIGASRRARRQADRDGATASTAVAADQLAVDDPTQVGEVQARDAWIAALEDHERQVLRLEQLVGLPTGVDVRLDLADLVTLDAAARERWVVTRADGELAPLASATSRLPDPRQAVLWGLGYRLDLRVAVGRVFDGQRSLAGPLDNTRADKTLLGVLSLAESLDTGEDPLSLVGPVDLTVGSVRQHRHRDDAGIDPSAVEAVRQLERAIQREVREGLARLGVADERLATELQSILVAQRRVAAGESDGGDLALPWPEALEAREQWVLARNSYAAALVRQRVVELELQRDLGVLVLDDRGLGTAPSVALQ